VELVADAHAADDEHLVVDDEHLGVIEATLVPDEAHVAVRDQRLGQRVGVLLERADAVVDDHQEHGLQRGQQVHVLVEEALLRAVEVLVVRPHPVLLDGHLHAALGGGEQRAPEHPTSLVVVPVEAAHANRGSRGPDALQDARERLFAVAQERERAGRLTSGFPGHGGAEARQRRSETQDPRPTSTVATAPHPASLARPARGRLAPCGEPSACSPSPSTCAAGAPG
jgi:hypothetical protein